MGIKDDLECEWVDTLVDRICDVVIERIPDWQVDPATANQKMDREVEEPDDYWRGYNDGIGDIKLMLEMIKDRQDA